MQRRRDRPMMRRRRAFLHFVMLRGVCPSFRTACPLSKCIHFYEMGVASFSKTHLIVEGCLDAIATEHSAATKSPSHLWALSLLIMKGRRRALQAASVESKISMTPSVVRRLFFATICVNRIYSCCAHQIDWLRALQSLDRQCNAYASVDQTVFHSPALSVLMGTPTAARFAHEASRFRAKHRVSASISQFPLKVSPTLQPPCRTATPPRHPR